MCRRAAGPIGLFLFKKLNVSTPRLLCNLHTMSLVKAVPDGLKDCKCNKIAFCERTLVPYVPKKNCLHETGSATRTTISRCRLAKVRNYKFLSDTLVHTRHFSSMWDLPWKLSRESGTSRPTKKQTRLLWNTVVGSSRQRLN